MGSIIITGIKELKLTLKKQARDFSKTERRALGKVMTKAKQAMAAEIRVFEKSGALRKSLGKKIKRMRTGRIFGMVGVRNQFGHTDKKGNLIIPNFYASVVESGKSARGKGNNQKPHWYRRKAWQKIRTKWVSLYKIAIRETILKKKK